MNTQASLAWFLQADSRLGKTEGIPAFLDLLHFLSVFPPSAFFASDKTERTDIRLGTSSL